MTSEKSVSNLSIGSAYESLGEIAGDDARKIIFQNSNLSGVLECPPAHNWKKEFTNTEQISIYRETMKLIGEVALRELSDR